MVFVPRPIRSRICHSKLSRARGLTALIFLTGACLPTAAQTASNPTAVNFGSEAVGTALAQTTVTFTVTASGTMGTPLVLTQGAPNLDYTLGTGSTCTGSVSGSTCTINVVFKPTSPGVRMGAVELTNSSGTVIATALIYGTGTGPQVTFTPGTITTIAGSGSFGLAGDGGFSGDGGSATSAEMSSPQGVAVDGAGNLYIADYVNNRIRKVTASTGDISTVAGSGPTGIGDGGYSGDGGAAPSAELALPTDVAVDGAGNLYIADFANNRIREVSASTGIITTVVGNGTGGYSGDGGAATSAEINEPYGVAVDGAGNLYIADYLNNRIRKVTASTGYISTVAGNGTAGKTGGGGSATSAELNKPAGVAVDGVGNLYIADFGNQLIRKVTASTGRISTVAGDGSVTYSGDGGLATSAGIWDPFGVAVDGAGNLYIGDTNHSRVRMVSASTGIITTVVGNGTAGYSGDGGGATSAEENQPRKFALDGMGNLYISEYLNNRIREVTAAAAPLSFASTAAGATSSNSPQTVIVNNIGNAALTFANPIGSGNNPSVPAGFSLGNTMTCPQLTQNSSAGTLASGASCTALVRFMPTAATSYSGNLIFTDNSLNGTAATQLVPLSGTGTADAFTVTGVSPASGPVVGGTAVTITGTGFSAATVVNFGTLPASSFTIVSATQINAMSPAEAAGTVDVIVGSATDVSVPATADQFTYAGVPTVTAVSPSSGSIAGGTAVTITGTNLTGATLVTFGGTAATALTVVNANTITVQTPANAAGAVDVVANAPGGSVTVSGGYTYLAPLVFVAGSGKIESYASDGTVTSSGTTFGGVGVAVDSSGHVWSVVNTGTSISRFTPLGAGVNEYSSDGLVGASALAIDGNSDVLVSNSNGRVTLLSNGGAVVSTTQGSTTGTPSSLAIDLSGNIWVANPTASTVDEIIGGAAPVSPLSTAITNVTPGARP